MTNPSVFLLSYVSDEEMPDRWDFLTNAAPFATQAGAEAEATRIRDSIAEVAEEPAEPFVWLSDDLLCPGIPTRYAHANRHVFVIRRFPLAD